MVRRVDLSRSRPLFSVFWKGLVLPRRDVIGTSRYSKGAWCSGRVLEEVDDSDDSLLKGSAMGIIIPYEVTTTFRSQSLRALSRLMQERTCSRQSYRYPLDLFQRSYTTL